MPRSEGTDLSTLDPSLNTDNEPVGVGKPGFDRTIPMDREFNRFAFRPCLVGCWTM